jgi:deoxyribose-phosphate aldolase
VSLIAAIEHTRLAADTTRKDVELACREALEFGFAGVCFAPCHVALASQLLAGSALRVVTVVGFPLGNSTATADAFAASDAIVAGAHEVDMVIPIGSALDGDVRSVERHIAQVRKAIPEWTLKVILEVGFFAPNAVENLARIAVDAGADYLKTATGFGPRGASVEDIELLSRVARAAGRPVFVKASGGIRSRQQAESLLDAGAQGPHHTALISISRAPRGVGTSKESPARRPSRACPRGARVLTTRTV